MNLRTFPRYFASNDGGIAFVSGKVSPFRINAQYAVGQMNGGVRNPIND